MGIVRRLGFQRTETTLHQASIRLNYLNGNRVSSTVCWNVRQVSLIAQQQNATPAPAKQQGHFEYDQKTGQMTHVLPDGKRVVVGTGYSGQGTGLNNPSEQYTPNSGPIPQGTYTIEPQRDNVTGAGHKLPGSMRLDPTSGTDTHGRAGFLIHGDNTRGDNSAEAPIVKSVIEDDAKWLANTVGGMLDAARSTSLMSMGSDANNTSAPSAAAGSQKAATASGVTAGGQATDRYGNKLGPSGNLRSTRRIATLAKPPEIVQGMREAGRLNMQLQQEESRTSTQLTVKAIKFLAARTTTIRTIK